VGLYVGLIVSVFALCAFCAAPVLGALSDRYGRRPILTLSLLGSAVGYFIFGLGGALWIMFAGRMIDGLTAGNVSTIYAYVADTFCTGRTRTHLWPARRGWRSRLHARARRRRHTGRDLSGRATFRRGRTDAW
jgi:MFS family permease